MEGIEVRNRPRKPTMVLFMGYVWATTMAGLVIHPYKSVKRMVMEKERRVFLPVVMTPTIAILFLFILGRLGSYFIETSGWLREVIATILGIASVGMLMWQVLMFILVIRFLRVYFR